MLKKTNILLLTILIGLFSSSSLNAMPREREHEQCLSKAVTDAAVTKCREEEIEAVLKELTDDERRVSEEKLTQSLAKSQGKNIEVLKKYFQAYYEGYCRYYVIAYKGNGYSDAYNKAKCELENLLQYEDDLISVYQSAGYDIKV